MSNIMIIYLFKGRIHIRNGEFYFSIEAKDVRVLDYIERVDFENYRISLIGTGLFQLPVCITLDIKTSAQLLGYDVTKILNRETDFRVVDQCISMLNFENFWFGNTAALRVSLVKQPYANAIVLLDKPDEIYLTNILSNDVLDDILHVIKGNYQNLIKDFGGSPFKNGESQDNSKQ